LHDSVPNNAAIWEVLTKIRTELRDPGLYRWPPHVNLLYPFVDITTSTTLKDNAVKSFEHAVQDILPFQVHLDSFGTFGGKRKGVLYIIPRSSRTHQNNNNHHNNNTVRSQLDNNTAATIMEEHEEEEVEPILELQSALTQQFSDGSDTQEKKNNKFTPHITVSHFQNLNDALTAQKQVEEWWDTSLCFPVNEIYVLQRTGDDGQFQISMTIPLKQQQREDSSRSESTSRVKVHDPPIAFPFMPLVEEDWVREERMTLKRQRKKKGKR